VTAFPGPGGTPVVLSLFGNPRFLSEDLRAYEFGYRVQRGKLSLDTATFYNVYHHLASQSQGAPVFEAEPEPHILIPLIFGNMSSGNSMGLEVAANWNVTPYWKLSGGYTYLNMQLKNPPAAPGGRGFTAGNNPRNQFQLRSYLNLPGKLQLDAALYHVSPLVDQDVAAYTRVDLRLGWRLAESIELSVGAQNLLQKSHPEFDAADIGIVDEGQVKRNAYAKLTWRF